MASLLPNDIIKDKIFIINRSDIEGRLDPKMALYNRKVQHSLYPLVTLGSLLQSKPQYGANEVGIPRVSHEEIKYIRITDIDEFGQVDSKGLGATVNNVEQKYILNENDILLARSGATVGKAYIHKQLPYKCLFAGYLIRFVIDANKAIPDYIFTYTQLSAYKEWVNAIQRPTGQPNINAEEYKSLEIPLPSISMQESIINIVNLAYRQKAKKDTEAKQLLETIDDYLLNELSIKLPEIQTDLANRIFYSSYKNIAGQRIDPKKYSKEVINLYASIKQTIYEIKTLKSLVVDSCSGDWGIEEDNNEHENYTKCLTLRATELDNKYNIKIQPDKAKYRLIKNAVYKKLNVAENDIIIEKSGGSKDQPVGRVAIITKDLLLNENIAFSNFLLKIKVADINPQYLYYFLRTMYNIGVTESMQSQTNGIRNLILDEFFTQTIVVPPMPKQQEIVEHITNIRQQAKALEEEGKAILERAKQEVERIIIG